MVAVPALVYPVAPSYVLSGRELVTATAAPAYMGFKAAAFKPTNKPGWLRDEALWGDMIKLHDLQQGPLWGEHEIPESPLYGDSIGTILYNFWGDYYTTATAASPTTTLNGGIAAGVTSLVAASGTGLSANQYIQLDTGVNAEVVQIAAGGVTGANITLNTNTPTRFSHLTGVALTGATGPYAHAFAALNIAGTGANPTSAQPPTNTFWHVNTPAGSGSYYADEFLYGIVTELTITGKATGWTTWSAKVTSLAQTAPGGALTGTLSTVAGIPAWRSTNTVASSAYPGITQWSATWTREIDVITTADGVQSPYALLRGAISSKFKLTYHPAVDETALSTMLLNTQPSLAWLVSNGKSSTNLVSLGVNSALAGYEGAVLTPNKVAWGYEVDGEFVGSTTYAGNSGGRTISQFVLTNNIPTY